MDKKQFSRARKMINSIINQEEISSREYNEGEITDNKSINTTVKNSENANVISDTCPSKEHCSHKEKARNEEVVVQCFQDYEEMKNKNKTFPKSNVQSTSKEQNLLHQKLRHKDDIINCNQTDLGIAVENNTDVDNNTFYENVIPGTSRQSNELFYLDYESDDLFDDIYSCDDLTNDPDFVPVKPKKRKWDFTGDFDLLNDLAVTDSDNDNENTQDIHTVVATEVPKNVDTLNITPLPILPPKPVFVATFPNSIIFVDSAEAAMFCPPARFIADHTGSIYDTNSDERNVDRCQDDNSEKNKRKHPFIPQNDCLGKCRRQCNFITQKERLDIWNYFWDMNYTMRRQFLNKSIRIEKIKQRNENAANTDPKHVKNESRYYHFIVDSKHINVCKKFFLTTLGLKSDGVITELSKAIKRKPLYADVKENRGGKKPKILKTPIEEHIMTYKPIVSHYRRHNAPNTRYLPRTLTLQSMLDDFRLKHPQYKICLETYRQTLKQMKVSLKFPKGDVCIDCSLFEEKINNSMTNNDTETADKVKEQFTKHKTKAEKAIKHYKEDALKKNTSQEMYFSMDLQKVTLLPDMPQVKDSFFLSRLIAFNLTFAPLMKKSNVNSKCVIWHEAFMGRDANNIIDAFIAFLESERDIKHLTIWCDNCTGQNKNWFIYTALVTIVNSDKFRVETIKFKYLTKGHTHMSADGVHGNIEKEFKSRGSVYDFNDYKDVIIKCRKEIEVIEVNYSYQWKKKKRGPKKTGNDPLKTFTLNPVVEAKFIRGSRNLFYKTNFNESYQELDFLLYKFDISVFPSLVNDIPRGIKQSKKDGILSKLVPLMPANRKPFWNSLVVNDTSDLCFTGQIIFNDEEHNNE